jgi:hypothetical protein
MSASAMDVFDFLRPRLLSSLLWRQRLPASGRAGPQSSTELIAQYRSIFSQLGEDLDRTLCDEQVLREFLSSRANSPHTSPDALPSPARLKTATVPKTIVK